MEEQEADRDRACFTMTKWKLHCAHFLLLLLPQLFVASASVAVWSEVKLKTDQRKMPQWDQHESTSGATRLSKLLPKKKTQNGQKGQQQWEEEAGG